MQWEKRRFAELKLEWIGLQRVFGYMRVAAMLLLILIRLHTCVCGYIYIYIYIYICIYIQHIYIYMFVCVYIYIAGGAGSAGVRAATEELARFNTSFLFDVPQPSGVYLYHS